VPRVLEFGPIGLEGFDGLLVDFMRRKNLAVEDVALLPEGGGFLLVEMGAWDAAEAQAKAEALARARKSWPASPAWPASTRPRRRARLARARFGPGRDGPFVPGEPESLGGLGRRRPSPGAPRRLSAQAHALMAEYGYSSPLYGHYGQGCVHLRINFDFRSEGLRKFREFIDRAADLVLSFGGSLSGEHGDGQSRAALLPKMFGPELMHAFQEFKAIWDPDNRMNPGKLV
jgi:FAD/FMN-containing dehydrogenase